MQDEENVESELPMPDNSRFFHVTVLLSQTGSSIKKNMRCMYWGMIIKKNNRLIEMIFEGRISEEKRGIEIQCRRCKTIYNMI